MEVRKSSITSESWCCSTAKALPGGCLENWGIYKPALVTNCYQLQHKRLCQNTYHFITKPNFQWDYQKKQQCVNFHSSTSASSQCGSTHSLKFEHPEERVCSSRRCTRFKSDSEKYCTCIASKDCLFLRDYFQKKELKNLIKCLILLLRKSEFRNSF